MHFIIHCFNIIAYNESAIAVYSGMLNDMKKHRSQLPIMMFFTPLKETGRAKIPAETTTSSSLATPLHVLIENSAIVVCLD